jgi:hypothetical protein
MTLTLPEALAVLHQFAPATMSMQAGDREMLTEAQRVVYETTRLVREQFQMAFRE